MNINGKEYAWGDVEVVLLGRQLLGIKGIEYGIKQEKEYQYGRGNKPYAIQKGNKTPEGSLTVSQSEIEALLQAAGSGNDITDIPPFNVIISYVPEEGDPIVTDICKNCEFTESMKSIKQNDKAMEITLPFMPLDIEYNA